MSTAAAESRCVSRCRTVQGADEIARRDEVDDQLALDQALAVGHVVELRGAVTELGDQVVAEIPVDDLELIDSTRHFLEVLDELAMSSTPGDVGVTVMVKSACSGGALLDRFARCRLAEESSEGPARPARIFPDPRRRR